MDKILKVHTVGDYERYIGAPELHPLVSVIHYDELEHCRHSLNNYDVYALFLADVLLEDLVYGVVTYDLNAQALMCVAPGQIGGKVDTGEEIQTRGWALLFSPDILSGTDLGRKISRYSFFSYNTSEALLMTPQQRETIVSLFESLRAELANGQKDEYQQSVIVSWLSLILDNVGRFYQTQLSTPSKRTSDILHRFEDLLIRYYSEDKQLEYGIPTVSWCASELFLSAGYFSDLVRTLTGEGPQRHIRRFLMEKARTLLADGRSVSETADALGFDYPQHFTRVFKNHFGVVPSKYQKQ
ncbi:MAG: AraC family transcriptional regulator [Bacteroidales bacterium]|nr:AraC family transcriptional regulator [Bacteroidales bacterium]